MRGGWTQEVARIEPGEEVAGGLLAFTDSEGRRFDPSTHVVQSVDIWCETPSGEALYAGTF